MLETHATELSQAPTEELWTEMRPLFDLDSTVQHMDANTLGSSLRCCEGPDEPICTTFADARQAIAPGFGCDVDEIAVTCSTTDSISKVLGGVNLRPGDEILTTNQEHYGGLAPMALARDRRGVVIRQIQAPVGNRQCAEDYVERFEASINDRTRVLLFSAPSAATGVLLPIRMLTRLAQQHDLISVVDGAHIPGMVDLSFHELGADFIAGSGNKWQCGPPGTGILYIRNKVLPQYNSRLLPEFWPIISVWYPLEGGLPARTTTAEPTYDIGEYVQNVGSASLGRMQALVRACETWNAIGRRRIQRHIQHLSRYLKTRVMEIWGESALYSPLDDSRLATGLSAFCPFRSHEDRCNEERFQTFVARLQDEYHIRARYTQFQVTASSAPHFAIRIATRPYHSRDDVDYLVRSMAKLADAM